MKVVSVAPMLDKWYIKPVISKDIRSLLHNIRNGKTSYTDEKYKIAYSVSAMDGTGKGEDSDDSGAEAKCLEATMTATRNHELRPYERAS